MRTMVMCFYLLAFCVAVTAQETASLDREHAERVWDLAIEAKGGRGKLQAIRNIHLSSNGGENLRKQLKNRTEFLIVYPNKLWEWRDLRPSVLGLEMTMYNLEISKRYVASQ